MFKSGLKLFKRKKNDVVLEEIIEVDEEESKGSTDDGLLTIHPSTYNKLNISPAEKKLIRNIKKIVSEGQLFINLNVINDESSHVLITNNNLVFIYPIETKSLETFISIKDLIYVHQLKKYKTGIKKRLLEHKALRKNPSDDSTLSFTFEVKFLLNVDVTDKEIKKLNLPKENIDFLVENVIKYDSLEKDLSKMPNKFSKDDILNITQMIAPEYTIPSKNDKKSESKSVGQPKDIDVSSILLDEKQINIINDIKSGHSLILASAGSGKSVILLSKALKVAARNPDKEVLLLCYNKNLASHYEWKISISGFRAKNLKCLTFHKLLEELLKEAGQSIATYKKGGDYFEDVYLKTRDLLNKGKISKKYHSVFIDEIQIFKTEWYKFCYNLIEDKNLDNHYLTICGDISQNVNKNIKAGRAPWQGEGLPSFRGRSIRLTKNYRNSQEITDFMNGFIGNVKETMDRFDIEVENENELFILGESVRDGDPVCFTESDRSNFIQKIVDEIKYYNEKKGVSLSEIAVIFPYREWKFKKYFLYYWLETKLKENYIDYSPIINTKKDYGKYYSQIDGVVLSTIESSLGLDFDAVIMTGFLPLGLRKNSKKIDRKRKGIDEETEQEFLDAVNKIYTGCTRARNYLSVITEESSSESIFVDFMKKSL